MLNNALYGFAYIHSKNRRHTMLNSAHDYNFAMVKVTDIFDLSTSGFYLI